MAPKQPPTPKPDAVVIDLDAMRAAHAAVVGVAPVVKWEGAELTLPATLPLAVLQDLGGLLVGRFSSIRRTFEALFAPEIVEDLWAKLDDKTTKDLVAAVAAAYGVTLGN